MRPYLFLIRSGQKYTLKQYEQSSKPCTWRGRHRRARAGKGRRKEPFLLHILEQFGQLHWGPSSTCTCAAVNSPPEKLLPSSSENDTASWTSCSECNQGLTNSKIPCLLTPRARHCCVWCSLCKFQVGQACFRGTSVFVTSKLQICVTREASRLAHQRISFDAQWTGSLGLR